MGGFLSSLSGGNQRRALRDSTSAALGSLKSGRTQALDEIDTGLNRSLAELNPYSQAGGRGLAALGDAIGTNGRLAQQTYLNNFEDDPGFQATVDYGLDQIGRIAAAQGQRYSGRTEAALFDHAQKSKYGQYQNRLDRLSGLSSLGHQAAGQNANHITNAFNQRADLDYGFAQQKANLHTGFGNAAAGTYSQGANNIIGLGTAAAQLAMGMPPTGLSSLGQSSGGSGNRIQHNPHAGGY